MVLSQVAIASIVVLVIAIAVIASQQQFAAAALVADEEDWKAMRRVVLVHTIWFDFGDGQSASRWEKLKPVIDTVTRCVQGRSGRSGRRQGGRRRRCETVHVVWNETSADKLITTCAPEVAALYYHKSAKPIHKVDILRIVLMKVFGGLYLDADVICNDPCLRRTVGHLFRHKSLAAVPVMKLTHGQAQESVDELATDVLWGARPNTPFWSAALRHLVQHAEEKLAAGAPANIATGPVWLKECIATVPAAAAPDLLHPSFSKPIYWAESSAVKACDFHSPEFSVEQCAETYPQCPLISLYMASWVTKEKDDH
jgi:hypothetical protein